MPSAPADSPEVVARVHEGMRAVDVIARQVQSETGWRHLDDLQSAGREGLLQAARNFDPSFGVPFRRFLAIRVRGAMIDALRSQTNLSRRARAHIRAIDAADRMSETAAEEEGQTPRPSTPEAADAGLSSYLANIATAMAMGLLGTPAKHKGPDEPHDLVDPHDSADDQMAQSQLMTQVREAVETLPDAERHLIKRHYFDGVEFVVAAGELGLSKSWASRLHTRAIEMVTRELRRRRVAP